MPYINKKVYGACEWKVSEKCANKNLSWREPSPVHPNFVAWFSSTFPGVEDNTLKSLIYRTIFSSAKNEEQPLGFEYLRDTYHLETKEISNVIQSLEKIFDIDCSFYSRIMHYARNIRIDQEKAQNLLTQWNSFILKKNHPEYSERISPFTFEKIDQKYQEVIVDSKNCIKKHTEKEYKENWNQVIRIIKYLNAREIPQIVFERLDQLIDSVNPKDALRYNRLTAVRNNLAGGNVWKIKDNAYRLFLNGESLCTISKEDRWSVLRQEDGFYELDLTNAHFAILAKLIDSQAMKEMLDNGSIWNQILTILSLPAEKKEQLKRVIYSILYGSGQTLQKILLIQDENTREELFQESAKILEEEKKAKTGLEKKECHAARILLEKKIREIMTPEEKELHAKLIAIPAIKDLMEGSDKLAKEIKEQGYFMDAFGKRQEVKGMSKGGILHFLQTSYEKVLLRPAYDCVFNQTSVGIIIDQHDGLTLDFSKLIGQKDKIEQKMAEIQNAVNENTKVLNINTRVQYKN